MYLACINPRRILLHMRNLCWCDSLIRALSAFSFHCRERNFWISTCRSGRLEGVSTNHHNRCCLCLLGIRLLKNLYLSQTWSLIGWCRLLVVKSIVLLFSNPWIRWPILIIIMIVVLKRARQSRSYIHGTSNSSYWCRVTIRYKWANFNVL